MDRTVSKLIARMPFNWLKSVGWFIPHFSAKARSESPESLIMSLIRSIIPDFVFKKLGNVAIVSTNLFVPSISLF